MRVQVPQQWMSVPNELRGIFASDRRPSQAEVVDANGVFIRQLKIADGVVDESDLFNSTIGAGNMARLSHIVKVTQLDDNDRPVSTSSWYRCAFVAQLPPTQAFIRLQRQPVDSLKVRAIAEACRFGL